MSNHFFRFKKFTVHQEHCALKVCTDACLFGAWTANLITNKNLQSNSILDIGTGTGLLSLMLAQQLSNSIIDAVEIDGAAAQQAAANFAASPWHEQLQVINTSIQLFIAAKQYNFIISNPPFFQNDLASPNTHRNIAMHSNGLKLEELLAAIQLHLSANGYLAILLPFHRTQEFETLAQHAHFCLHQKTSVQQTPNHPPFRSMLLFGREPKAVEQTTIVIKDEAGNHTDAFIRLLKDYYLYL